MVAAQAKHATLLGALDVAHRHAVRRGAHGCFVQLDAGSLVDGRLEHLDAQQQDAAALGGGRAGREDENVLDGVDKHAGARAHEANREDELVRWQLMVLKCVVSGVRKGHVPMRIVPQVQTMVDRDARAPDLGKEGESGHGRATRNRLKHHAGDRQAPLHAEAGPGIVRLRVLLARRITRSWG